jgi:hypothetical protein
MMAMIPLWPAAIVAFSTATWWRRPALAVLPMIVLDFIAWIARSETLEPEYVGDVTMWYWLPFLAAAAVTGLVALGGRWRTWHDDRLPSAYAPVAQFSLRDLFMATAIVAACIPAMQAMVVSWLRESTKFLDGLSKVLALMAAGFVAPPAALILVSTVRLILAPEAKRRWPVVLLCLGWLTFVVYTAISFLGSSDPERYAALQILAFAGGITADAALGGLLLRWLGYRVQPGSWRRASLPGGDIPPPRY